MRLNAILRLRWSIGIGTRRSALLACLFVPMFIPAFAQERTADTELNTRFVQAIEKGDLKEIKDLATKGADLNSPTTVVDIDDVQVVPGGFSYKFKQDAPIGGSKSMLAAIESARAATVRELIEMGANVKTPFFVDADLGIEISAKSVESQVQLGLYSSVGGADNMQISKGRVISPVRPTPAMKATYLSIAEGRLARADWMARGGAQRIVKLLRQATQQP
jgi:hypothetical protein